MRYNYMDLPRFVLFVDPGESTGWCLLRLRPRTALDVATGKAPLYQCVAYGTARMTGAGSHDWDHGEHRLYKQVHGFLADVWVNTGGTGVQAIVIEDFILYAAAVGNTPTMKREGLSPVRVTSMMLGLLWSQGFRGEVTRQQTSQVNGKRAIVTNEHLKAAELWVLGGKSNPAMTEHTRDALKHAVVWGRTNEFEVRGMLG